MALPQGSVVFADPDTVARQAAKRLADLCADRTRPVAAVCLSGGSSPRLLYRTLASEPFAGRLDWGRIHWFWGDERFVPPDHKDSNARMVREALLDHVAVPGANIHPVPTDLADPDAAAAAYQATLMAFYGADTLDPARPLFDLVLLGIGEDGHTGSLFPGKPATGERRRWVAPVPEAGLAPFVPRVTLTFPTLASSREVLFLATGRGKHDMLSRIGAGEDVPAARVTSAGRIAWFLDREAETG
jgi:6-phosphogluconolactonase